MGPSVVMMENYCLVSGRILIVPLYCVNLLALGLCPVCQPSSLSSLGHKKYPPSLALLLFLPPKMLTIHIQDAQKWIAA